MRAQVPHTTPRGCQGTPELTYDGRGIADLLCYGRCFNNNVSNSYGLLDSRNHLLAQSTFQQAGSAPLNTLFPPFQPNRSLRLNYFQPQLGEAAVTFCPSWPRSPASASGGRWQPFCSLCCTNSSRELNSDWQRPHLCTSSSSAGEKPSAGPGHGTAGWAQGEGAAAVGVFPTPHSGAPGTGSRPAGLGQLHSLSRHRDRPGTAALPGPLSCRGCRRGAGPSGTRHTETPPPPAPLTAPARPPHPPGRAAPRPACAGRGAVRAVPCSPKGGGRPMRAAGGAGGPEPAAAAPRPGPAASAVSAAGLAPVAIAAPVSQRAARWRLYGRVVITTGRGSAGNAPAARGFRPPASGVGARPLRSPL